LNLYRKYLNSETGCTFWGSASRLCVVITGEKRHYRISSLVRRMLVWHAFGTHWSQNFGTLQAVLASRKVFFAMASTTLRIDCEDWTLARARLGVGEYGEISSCKDGKVWRARVRYRSAQGSIRQ